MVVCWGTFEDKWNTKKNRFNLLKQTEEASLLALCYCRIRKTLPVAYVTGPTVVSTASTSTKSN